MTKKAAPNRSTDKVIFVRLKTADREIVEKAIAKELARSTLPGAKTSLSGFALAATVEKAKAILKGS
jgi:uncharacterized protein (DUF1778 family)